MNESNAREDLDLRIDAIEAHRPLLGVVGAVERLTGQVRLARGRHLGGLTTYGLGHDRRRGLGPSGGGRLVDARKQRASQDQTQEAHVKACDGCRHRPHPSL